MPMKDPVHPGAIVREDCLKPLGFSVSEGAKRLGIRRQALSKIVGDYPLYIRKRDTHIQCIGD